MLLQRASSGVRSCSSMAPRPSLHVARKKVAVVLKVAKRQHDEVTTDTELIQQSQERSEEVEEPMAWACFLAEGVLEQLLGMGATVVVLYILFR